MFRPHHPASIEFWIALSAILSFYNFLVQQDFLSESKVLLKPADISLLLVLILMGLITSLFLRSRKAGDSAESSAHAGEKKE